MKAILTTLAILFSQFTFSQLALLPNQDLQLHGKTPLQIIEALRNRHYTLIKQKDYPEEQYEMIEYEINAAPDIHLHYLIDYKSKACFKIVISSSISGLPETLQNLDETLCKAKDMIYSSCPGSSRFFWYNIEVKGDYFYTIITELPN